MRRMRMTFGRVITLATLVGLLAFLIYLVLSGSIFHIASVLERVNLMLYSFTFLFVVSGSLFYSLSWRSLLKRLEVTISIWRAFVFNWAGLLFEITIPGGIAGDLTRAYFTSRYLKKDAGKILASVIGQRVLVGITTLGTLIAGLILLSLSYGLMTSTGACIVSTIVVIVALLLVIVILSTHPKLTRTLTRWTSGLIYRVRKGNFNRNAFESGADQILGAFHDGVRLLGSNSKAWVRPVTLFLASWILEIFVFFWVFVVVGYPISADKVLISFSILALVQGFGSVLEGSAEAAMSVSYVSLGIPVDVAVATTALARVSTFWFKLLVSYGTFHLLGGIGSKDNRIGNVPIPMPPA